MPFPFYPSALFYYLTFFVSLLCSSDCIEFLYFMPSSYTTGSSYVHGCQRTQRGVPVHRALPLSLLIVLVLPAVFSIHCLS